MHQCTMACIVSGLQQSITVISNTAIFCMALCFFQGKVFTVNFEINARQIKRTNIAMIHLEQERFDPPLLLWNGFK